MSFEEFKYLLLIFQA